MTEQEIQEGNILIAEFLGFTESEGIHVPPIYVTEYYRSSLYFTTLELKFSYSWDWLMPVIDKIETLKDESGLFYEVCIAGKEAFIHCESDSITKSYYKEFKIESVYLAIIEFIKWYNEQSK